MLINFTEIVKDSVTIGLQKTGMKDTPENRITILSTMHKELTEDGIGYHALTRIKQNIEDEIIRLNDALVDATPAG